jgi:hypothetical protein
MCVKMMMRVCDEDKYMMRSVSLFGPVGCGRPLIGGETSQAYNRTQPFIEFIETHRGERRAVLNRQSADLIYSSIYVTCS